jgi:hypothetical protein
MAAADTIATIRVAISLALTQARQLGLPEEPGLLLAIKIVAAAERRLPVKARERTN